MADEPTGELDFEAQMREIESQISQRKPSSSGDAPRGLTADSLKPVTAGIEGIIRALGQQARAIEDIKKAEAARPPVAPELLNQIQKLDSRLAQMEDSEQANRKLFDALHDELKGYKDGFLFDALQKPIIRDILMLHDDLTQLSEQITRFRNSLPGDSGLDEEKSKELGHIDDNSTNLVEHLLEILLRLEVEKSAPATGKLDRRLHKAMQLEPTENPDEDQDIVKELKPGFTWKERMLRPPEVAVKKLRVAE